MATYVMSDIHGYCSRMFDVLEKAKFNWREDELYILGDIIDRGPESAEMLEWAIEEAPSNVHFLLGNHEDMAYSGFFKVQDEGPVSCYLYDNPWAWNGGKITLDACRESRGSEWCHKVAKWIFNLPLYYSIELNGKKILMVHAGLAEDLRMSDDFFVDGKNEYVDIPGIGEIWSQHLLWVRERWFYNQKPYPYDMIIFGHSPTTVYWWEDLKISGSPIEVEGKPGDIVRMTANVDGYGTRICVDTGRRRMGLLRLDDMAEFYSEFEIESELNEQSYLCVICSYIGKCYSQYN